MSDSPAVGFVYDDRYLRNNPGTEVFWTLEGRLPVPYVEPTFHPSNFRLVIRTKHLLELTRLSTRVTRLGPRPASPDELEGGYAELYAPYCTLGIIESLAGFRTQVHEPQDLACLERRPEIATVGAVAAAALNDIEAIQAMYWPVLS